MGWKTVENDQLQMYVKYKAEKATKSINMHSLRTALHLGVLALTSFQMTLDTLKLEMKPTVKLN